MIWGTEQFTVAPLFVGVREELLTASRQTVARICSGRVKTSRVIDWLDLRLVRYGGHDRFCRDEVSSTLWASSRTQTKRAQSGRFLGSGSTLIVADEAGRVRLVAELDPLYVEVIIRRYEAATCAAAVLVATGETFAAAAAR
jgi:hypothetical protein